MRAAIRHFSAVRNTASHAVTSNRSVSNSSDKEVVRHLSRSHIFKDYERAFSKATGLPLNIREHYSWSRRRTMEKRIKTRSPQFWLILQGSRRMSKSPNPRISRTGLDSAHRHLVCGCCGWHQRMDKASNESSQVRYCPLQQLRGILGGSDFGPSFCALTQ